MIIEKDTNNNSLYIIDNNDIIFRTTHIGGEFVIIKSTNKLISITENDDKYLYNNLLWILDNKYIFDNELSYIVDNKIIWFSDQACDIENKKETDKINRIVIEKSCDSILITCYNPFYERNNIKKSQYTVAFTPGGNGFYSKNLVSGSTFQNDFIKSLYMAISNEYIGLKDKSEKVYKKTRRL